jgi:integration host factor subunit alpha
MTEKTVTRAMLSEWAAEATGLARHDVAAIGDRMFELIGQALMDGESAKLTGFGSLQVRTRAERVGRNPRTGDEHKIPPHNTVVLVPSAHLRALLDGKKG